MSNRFHRCCGLFLSFFKIAAFTVGGGLVMLPLMEEEFVQRRQWITDKEFMSTVALVNTLPGVIAVNTALAIGHRAAGFLGAVAAMLGALSPSILIILLLSPIIILLREIPTIGNAFLGVRGSVAALILLLVIRQGQKMGISFIGIILALGALLAVRVIGIHPLIIIPTSAILGAILFRKDNT